ncbi:MAG: cytochrome c [Gammaproteobacteria bacterium]|jgi:cytochrome c556
MKKTIAIAAAATLFALAGCGGGAPAMDDSPEGQAYAYRHAVMELIAAKMGLVGGMARGEVPDDQAAFTKAAADLVTLTGMITEGFETEGIPAGSRSVPDIWTNMADFEEKAQATVDAVTAVANAAQSGNFAGAKELAGDIGGTCGGCHRPYRAAAE